MGLQLAAGLPLEKVRSDRALQLKLLAFGLLVVGDLPPRLPSRAHLALLDGCSILMT
jgi:hypothetical protein